LKYPSLDGTILESPRQSLLVRVQGSEPRREIPNPFKQYAGGIPVEEPEMFFGRDKLIDELTRDLSRTPGGTCIALYGQQRTGKSSVLSQVSNRLPKDKTIVARLSMGTMDRR